MSEYLSFSPEYSSQRPLKTAKPPSEPIDASKKNLNIYYVVTGIPFLLYLAGAIFLGWKIDHHYKKLRIWDLKNACNLRVVLGA
jgi:hypothetical protein